MPGKLEFWFEYASTYSYLAAERIEALARERGVTILWKPFLLGPIFQQQGWTTSPFNIYPAKGKNMWRDMERLTQKFDLPFDCSTESLPRNSLLAARVGVLGAGEPWVPEYTRQVYRASFGRDQDIARPEVISEILTGLSLDAPTVLEIAQSAENKDALKRQTGQAMEKGIFGAPSFTVGDELFWGHDRMIDALDWASGGG